jgi:cytochrome c oxidase subunit III
VSVDTHAPAHDAHGHHGPLQHQFDDLDQQRDANNLGMWLFLATEVMMFGGLFFAYSLYRWKFAAAFEWGSGHMDVRFGTLNTFILLASSFTVALAVHAAGEQRRRATAKFLFITLLFGIGFLVVKGFEWTHDWNIGLVPGLQWHYFDQHPAEAQALLDLGSGPHHVLMFFVIYFSMTGLHAIHMIVGLALVGYFILLANKGQFLNGNDQPVEILGLYWHLVDIIWIFLFPLLYLIAGFHPFGGGGGH